MNIDYKLIGKRIQKIRKDRSITQETLAENIGVTTGYISQIERGITKVNLDTLSHIATILDCDISFFITGTVKSSNNYLEEDLNFKIKSLTSQQKELLLHIADNIIKYG